MFQRVPVSPVVRAWLLHSHNITDPRNQPIKANDRNAIGFLTRYMLYSMPAQLPNADDLDDPSELSTDILIDVPTTWVCEMFPPSPEQYQAFNNYLYKNMVEMLQHSIVTMHTFGIFGADAEMLTQFIEVIGIDDRDDRVFFALQKAVQRLSVRQGRHMKRARGIIIEKPTTTTI